MSKLISSKLKKSAVKSATFYYISFLLSKFHNRIEPTIPPKSTARLPKVVSSGIVSVAPWVYNINWGTCVNKPNPPPPKSQA